MNQSNPNPLPSIAPQDAREFRDRWWQTFTAVLPKAMDMSMKVQSVIQADGPKRAAVDAQQASAIAAGFANFVMGSADSAGASGQQTIRN